jgi:hypothetical protein
VKAPVIFMVLLSLVIFDEVSPTLSPVRNHSGPGALHDPRIVEPDEAKRKANGNSLFLLLSSSYSRSNLKGFVLAY